MAVSVWRNDPNGSEGARSDFVNDFASIIRNKCFECACWRRGWPSLSSLGGSIRTKPSANTREECGLRRTDFRRTLFALSHRRLTATYGSERTRAWLALMGTNSLHLAGRMECPRIRLQRLPRGGMDLCGSAHAPESADIRTGDFEPTREPMGSRTTPCHRYTSITRERCGLPPVGT